MPRMGPEGRSTGAGLAEGLNTRALRRSARSIQPASTQSRNRGPDTSLRGATRRSLVFGPSWLRLAWVLVALSAASASWAQRPAGLAPDLLTKAAQPADLALSLRLMIGMALLSLAPALLIMLTGFTRIVIILSFLRSALNTQQTPPNSVLIGLALFLTVFVMHPTWERIDKEAVRPYMAGKLTYAKALERGEGPLREFMFSQAREKDIALFVRLSDQPRPRDQAAIATYVLIPAFVISELKSAFQIGFVLYLPFLVIDMVVASALMSMGMMMLPPTMIALPFKILLFVMIDGWHLIAQSIVLSFG